MQSLVFQTQNLLNIELCNSETIMPCLLKENLQEYLLIYLKKTLWSLYISQVIYITLFISRYFKAALQKNMLMFISYYLHATHIYIPTSLWTRGSRWFAGVSAGNGFLDLLLSFITAALVLVEITGVPVLHEHSILSHRDLILLNDNNSMPIFVHLI